jgi:hypothetical protein
VDQVNGNGQRPPPAAPPRGGAFIGLGIAGTDAGDQGRVIPSRGENYRHIRRAEILARWPVLPDDWAHRVERARLLR